MDGLLGFPARLLAFQLGVLIQHHHPQDNFTLLLRRYKFGAWTKRCVNEKSAQLYWGLIATSRIRLIHRDKEGSYGDKCIPIFLSEQGIVKRAYNLLCSFNFYKNLSACTLDTDNSYTLFNHAYSSAYIFCTAYFILKYHDFGSTCSASSGANPEEQPKIIQDWGFS